MIDYHVCLHEKYCAKLRRLIRTGLCGRVEAEKPLFSEGGRVKRLSCTRWFLFSFRFLLHSIVQGLCGVTQKKETIKKTRIATCI